MKKSLSMSAAFNIQADWFKVVSSFFDIGLMFLEKKVKMGKFKFTDGRTDDGLPAIRKAHVSF